MIFNRLKQLTIWLRAQCITYNINENEWKESQILQEFRDCFCYLFLNKNFYSNEKSMTILDDYFCMLKGVIGNVPYRTIITKEMLLRILSFSDLLLKQGNESIINSYILLLKEFMRVVKFLSTQDMEIKEEVKK